MKKLLALLLVVFSIGTAMVTPAEARYRDYNYNGGYGYHPYIQKALIGGGIGAVAGAVLGERDPVGAGLKGALIGSAAGVGYEYLRSGRYVGNGGYGGYGRGYGNSGGYRSCGYGGHGRGYGGRGHHYGHSRRWN